VGALIWVQTLGLTRSQHPVEGHPYLRLLRLYLEEFLPRNASSRPTDRMTGVVSTGVHIHAFV
jgi:hypothetical protein